MRVRVILYGWFRLGVENPDGLIKLTLPDDTNIARVIEILRETSPMLHSRACLAMIGGARAPLDQTFKDGEEVGLYPIFSGG